MSTWRRQLLERSAEVVASGKGLSTNQEAEIKFQLAKFNEIILDERFLLQNARLISINGL